MNVYDVEKVRKEMKIQKSTVAGSGESRRMKIETVDCHGRDHPESLLHQDDAGYYVVENDPQRRSEHSLSDIMLR